MKLAQKIPSKKASGNGIMGGALLVGLTIILFIGLVGLVSTPVLAGGKGKHWHPRACSQTASAAYIACYNEKKDDYWIAQGNCYNLSEREAQAECSAEAKGEYKEAKQECRDQLEARKDLCEELGEAPYDPQINPDDFIDFEAVLDGDEVFSPNPYFPLVPGTIWEYKTRNGAGDLIERIKVEVLEETKEILGVNCIVVHDRVWEVEDGEESLIEDTYDWYTQEKNENDGGEAQPGNVWYFGEIAQDFEDGTLVSIDGSWTAGVDGAKPGILMFVTPKVGDVYRQEFALGEAEDWAKVRSLEADESVPAADCEEKCVQNEEGTPIEPDVIEFKYYKSGFGTVLEENPETGERVELVGFSKP